MLGVRTKIGGQAGASPPTLTRDQRELLIASYQAERGDETAAFASVLSLLAATIGLLTIMGFALVAANRHQVPAWLVALIPLPPLPFMAFGALQSMLARVRGKVIESYESALIAAHGAPMAENVPVPSGLLMLREVWLGWFGRVVIGVSWLALLSMYVAALVESFRYSIDKAPVLAIASLAGCSTGALVIMCLYVAALWPERLMNRVGRRLVNHHEIVEGEVMVEADKNEEATPDLTYRDWLVKAHHTASQDFDKALMTLAGGALGISLAFIHDVAPHPHSKWLIATGWGSLALSLLLIITSYLTSQEALWQAIGAVDNPDKEPRPDRFGRATAVINWASAGCFIIGVVFVVIFAVYSLSG